MLYCALVGYWKKYNNYQRKHWLLKYLIYCIPQIFISYLTKQNLRGPIISSMVILPKSKLVSPQKQ